MGVTKSKKIYEFTIYFHYLVMNSGKRIREIQDFTIRIFKFFDLDSPDYSFDQKSNPMLLLLSLCLEPTLCSRFTNKCLSLPKQKLAPIR